METWLTYEPADFLLFSERVYWRLFVLENAARWPLPVLAPLALLAALLWHLRRPAWGLRALAGVVALVLLSVGWHFVWQRYTPVNWAAAYAAPLYAVQAGLIAWSALTAPRAGRPGSWRAVTGRGLIAAALIYPLLAPVAGRDIAGAEVFGVAPDPTLAAALGVALLVPGAWRGWILLGIPAVLLIASGLTRALLAGAAALPPLLLVAAAVAANALAPRHS
jgi:hypothetical protein